MNTFPFDMYPSAMDIGLLLSPLTPVQNNLNSTACSLRGQSSSTPRSMVPPQILLSNSNGEPTLNQSQSDEELARYLAASNSDPRSVSSWDNSNHPDFGLLPDPKYAESSEVTESYDYSSTPLDQLDLELELELSEHSHSPNLYGSNSPQMYDPYYDPGSHTPTPPFYGNATNNPNPNSDSLDNFDLDYSSAPSTVPSTVYHSPSALNFASPMPFQSPSALDYDTDLPTLSSSNSPGTYPIPLEYQLPPIYPQPSSPYTPEAESDLGLGMISTESTRNAPNSSNVQYTYTYTSPTQSNHSLPFSIDDSNGMDITKALIHSPLQQSQDQHFINMSDLTTDSPRSASGSGSAYYAYADEDRDVMDGRKRKREFRAGDDSVQSVGGRRMKAKTEVVEVKPKVKRETKRERDARADEEMKVEAETQRRLTRSKRDAAVAAIARMTAPTKRKRVFDDEDADADGEDEDAEGEIDSDVEPLDVESDVGDDADSDRDPAYEPSPSPSPLPHMLEFEYDSRGLPLSKNNDHDADSEPDSDTDAEFLAAVASVSKKSANKRPGPIDSRKRRSGKKARNTSIGAADGLELLAGVLGLGGVNHEYDESGSAEGCGGVRRKKNNPIPLPIVIPNLTKKSRGRKVPAVSEDAQLTVSNKKRKMKVLDKDDQDTSRSSFSHPARSPSPTPSFAPSSASDDEGNAKKRKAQLKSKSRKGKPGPALSERTYMCKVPGCGKCFVRGEHLKRHVRSIHTYEKRECRLHSCLLHCTDVFILAAHLCPYPDCGKSFSRRDNLGQHARLHL